jgi:nicotinate-nucleotide--dimethylbenzimidazole phosphoribosyltransferase
VLLLLASFGDPASVLHQFDAVLATISAGHAPAVAPAAHQHAVAVVPPSQPQSAPQAQAAQGPSAQSPAPADQAAAVRAQRDALQQQLQRLQAEMAQESQAVSSLHDRADTERHALAALQQQPHAAADAPANQPGAEQSAANAPAAAAQAAAPQQVAQAADQPAALPLPPPLPPDPPQQPPVSTAAPAAPSPQGVARAGAVNAAALEAVLDKLRHAPPGAAPQAASPQPDVAAPGGDSIVAYNEDPSRRANAAAGTQQQIGPRERLGMARAALQAGSVDAARQYLEEAQLQLVFQPVTPTADDAPTGSRAAGDVASALSLLGSGNISAALYYVDRAMGQTQQGVYPPPGSYPGGAYAGAPVPDTGRVAETGQ